MIYLLHVSEATVEARKLVRGVLPAGEYRGVSDLPPPDALTAGDVLVALGGAAADLLRAGGHLHKSMTLDTLRERVHAYSPARLLVSYSPNILRVDPDKRVLVEWDLRLALRVSRTGDTRPDLSDRAYRWVSNFNDAFRFVRRRHAETGEAVPVSLDLETVGRNPFAEPSEDHPGGQIVSVSVSYDDRQADVWYCFGCENPDVVDQLRRLCSSDKVRLVGANLKFDAVWLRVRWGVVVRNQRFDTFLVGSLLNENLSNSLNLHAKMYSDIGGYDDCVAPGTRVCTADLRWVPVEDIKPGDKLVGFDEEIAKPGHRRLMRVAVAESTKVIQKPMCRVFFSDGTVIRCSQDHGFLAHRYKNNGPFQWVRAKNLKMGCRVQVAVPVVRPDDSFGAGYISGLYDGEGYLSHAGVGITSGISQRPGPVWDEYCRIMGSRGFGGFYEGQKNTDGVMTSKHSGWQTLQILQAFRPVRLLEKYGYDGHAIPSGAPKVTVASVELLDELDDVISLQTSTRTFVAEGICSHNSFNAQFDKSRMDLVPRDDLLTYAGGDTDACLQVYRAQRRALLRRRRLANFYVNLLQPAADAFAALEARGVLVDLERYAEVEAELRAEIDECAAVALRMVPATIRRALKEEQLKLTNPTLLRRFLFSGQGLDLTAQVFTEKTREPSTAIDHLARFKDHPDAGPFVELLRRFNGANKMLSTYVVGFLKHLRSDGRYHPAYYLGHSGRGGTVTGRLSARDPSYQTIPKHNAWAARLRACFVPPPGHGILKADYCVAPSTRVLTDDLRYVRADEIAEGQAVLAFDETSTLHQHRKLREAVVEKITTRQAKRVRLTFEDGSSVVSSLPHRWLCRSRRHKTTEWRVAADIRVGDRVRRICDVFEADKSYEAGWLSGILDGEGYINTSSGVQVGVAQVSGSVRERVSAGLETMTTTPSLGTARIAKKNKSCKNLNAMTIYRLDDVLKVLGVLRPVRLLQSKKWLGRRLPKTGCKTVTAVELLGVGPVVSIRTSTGTFIAEGLASHNSQGELRVTACVSAEPTMLGFYLSEERADLHLRTGASLTGYSLEDARAMLASEDPDVRAQIKRIRQGGKIGNFGLIYGMSPEGLVDYARRTYGVIMSLREAEAFHAKFFDTYPGLLGWHRRFSDYAHEHLEVSSPLGRVRHLPQIRSPDDYARSAARRMAINSPIQSTLSDMMLLAVAELHRHYPDLQVFGTTHDEAQMYVPLDERDLWVGRVRDVMEGLPLERLGWRPQLSFPVDMEWSESSLGECEEL